MNDCFDEANCSSSTEKEVRTGCVLEPPPTYSGTRASVFELMLIPYRKDLLNPESHASKNWTRDTPCATEGIFIAPEPPP